MAGYVGRQTRATLAFTDKRLRLVTEVVTGVRLLKFFAWEDRFRCGEGRGGPQSQCLHPRAFGAPALNLPL